MKKLFGFLGAFSLTFMLVLGGPMFSTAAQSTTDSNVESTSTKQIVNYLVIYERGVTPKSTYYYDFGGWKGTLRLSMSRAAGDHTLAYYSGTVSCQGICAVNVEKDE